MLDQAGWHLSDKLAIQANITLLPLPPKCPELNPVEKRMAVYAGKLALEPHLHVLRQRRRSLLLRLEQACRPTMACHDHWTAQMGSSAIINESWYKRESEGMKAGAWGRRCYADEPFIQCLTALVQSAAPRQRFPRQDRQNVKHSWALLPPWAFLRPRSGRRTRAAVAVTKRLSPKQVGLVPRRAPAAVLPRP